MRDRPSPHHKLEWPGGVVPEWARPQQNSNKRRAWQTPAMRSLSAASAEGDHGGIHQDGPGTFS